MVGKEIRRDLKYTDVELPSGIKVSGIVIVKDGQMHSTNGYIIAKYTDERSFRFKLYQKSNDVGFENILGEFTEMVTDTLGIKEGMNSNVVIEEFKAFVAGDLA